MGKSKFGTMTELGEVADGDAVDVSNLEKLGVNVAGTFVGTWVLEQSFDAGVTWAQAPANAAGVTATGTAPKAYNFDVVPQQIRVNCTAWTSGAINPSYAGKDEDRLG